MTSHDPIASTSLRFAAVKYAVGEPANFTAFANRIEALCSAASAEQARVLVLPEYLSLELAYSLQERADLIASLHALQAYHAHWMTLFQLLSNRFGLVIQAGTFLLRLDSQHFCNRAYLFRPDAQTFFQDKLQLTGFEKAIGVISPGEALSVLQTEQFSAGIAVCYDVEFPILCRLQREQGAHVLLVPSCTDTDAGANRVRVGCLARALENRFFIVQSVTAGLAEWSPALDSNTGEASIYAPMDHGFPDNGIIVQSQGAQELVFADLDFASLSSSRTQAQVQIDSDWPLQHRFHRAGVV